MTPPTPEQLQDALQNILDTNRCEKGHEHIYERDALVKNRDIIEFALRFTAKALGEPSESMVICGQRYIHSYDTTLIFKAMIQQIAKECA